MFLGICGSVIHSIRNRFVSFNIIIVKTNASEACVTILNVVAFSITFFTSTTLILKTEGVSDVKTIPTVRLVASWKHRRGHISCISLRSICDTRRWITIPTVAIIPWGACDEYTSGHAIAHREAWPTAAPMVIGTILPLAKCHTHFGLAGLSSACTIWPIGFGDWK